MMGGQEHNHPRSRREVVAGLGAVIAGASVMAGSIGEAFAQPASQKRKRLKVPKNAVDAHVHVFDPQNFEYSAGRSYTPPAATVANLMAFEESIGVDRVVLVQPSPYGSDNSCLLAALKQLGPKVARGVAVINPHSVTDEELETLKDAGVVAVRVNLQVKGVDQATAAASQVSAAIKRVADHGLAIQIYLDLHLVEPIVPILRDAPVPIILDHYAGAKASLGPDQQGFTTMLRAMQRGNVWVKMSAPYRASKLGPDYPDVAPLAKAMIEANPDRLVWASDWPHTGGGAERQARSTSDVEPFRTIDDQRVLDLMREWCGSDTMFKRILVDNAETLFRFK